MATDLESGGLPSPMTTQSSSRTRAKLKPKGLDPISKKGYGKVAWLMARSDTSDLAIFRKFGELNLLNLMSLQAELMSLQAVLRNQYERDENKGFKYSFLDLRKNTNESFEEDMEERLADQERLDVIESDDEDFMPSPIYDTLRRIRKKLKAYNEALMQLSQLESLEKPHPKSLRCLQLWLVRYKSKEENEDNYSFLKDEEGFTWNGTKDMDDFVAIRAPLPQKDGFQESLTPKIVSMLWFFRHTVPKWCHKMADQFRDRQPPGTDDRQKSNEKEGVEKLQKPEDEEAENEEVEDEDDLQELRIHSVAKIISRISAFTIAILAALIPVLSMVALYFIHRTVIRLYALIGLTVAFALAVKFLTSAKSSDVFAVAAAFVAIEAVFVGSPGRS